MAAQAAGCRLREVMDLDKQPSGPSSKRALRASVDDPGASATPFDRLRLGLA